MLREELKRELYTCCSAMALSSSGIEWTRSSTLHFISLLRRHPAIWNVKSKEYKKKHVRNTSLEMLKEDLSRVMKCRVKKEAILKKVHTLKTQFQREVVAMKAWQNSGEKTDDYTPKLWCFDELRFIGDGDIKRASTSNLDEGGVTAEQVS